MVPVTPRARRVWRNLACLAIFAVAFGYLEAAVVVYLRRIVYPGGFTFPLVTLDRALAGTEIAREVATLVMLIAIAAVAARSRWGRFGAFAVGFGIWDLAYYVGLKALLDWPPTWSTWDVLFLIPAIWTGPVWSAAVIAGLLASCGTVIWLRAEAGFRPRLRWPHWCAATTSLLILLGVFLANHRAVAAGSLPGRFPWEWWALGVGLGLATFALLFARRGELRREPSPT
jgi:hypothetical protein